MIKLKNRSFEQFFVPFGRITNMSTRKGKVEFLSDLINEAKLVAQESMQFSKSNFFNFSIIDLNYHFMYNLIINKLI